MSSLFKLSNDECLFRERPNFNNESILDKEETIEKISLESLFNSEIDILQNDLYVVNVCDEGALLFYITLLEQFPLLLNESDERKSIQDEIIKMNQKNLSFSDLPTFAFLKIIAMMPEEIISIKSIYYYRIFVSDPLQKSLANLIIQYFAIFPKSIVSIKLILQSMANYFENHTDVVDMDASIFFRSLQYFSNQLDDTSSLKGYKHLVTDPIQLKSVVFMLDLLKHFGINFKQNRYGILFKNISIILERRGRSLVDDLSAFEFLFIIAAFPFKNMCLDVIADFRHYVKDEKELLIMQYVENFSREWRARQSEYTNRILINGSYHPYINADHFKKSIIRGSRLANLVFQFSTIVKDPEFSNDLSVMQYIDLIKIPDTSQDITQDIQAYKGYISNEGELEKMEVLIDFLKSMSDAFFSSCKPELYLVALGNLFFSGRGLSAHTFLHVIGKIDDHRMVSRDLIGLYDRWVFDVVDIQFIREFERLHTVVYDIDQNLLTSVRKAALISKKIIDRQFKIDASSIDFKSFPLLAKVPCFSEGFQSWDIFEEIIEHHNTLPWQDQNQFLWIAYRLLDFIANGAKENVSAKVFLKMIADCKHSFFFVRQSGKILNEKVAAKDKEFLRLVANFRVSLHSNHHHFINPCTMKILVLLASKLPSVPDFNYELFEEPASLCELLACHDGIFLKALAGDIGVDIRSITAIDAIRELQGISQCEV